MDASIRIGMKNRIRTLGIHPKFFNLLLKQGGKDIPRLSISCEGIRPILAFHVRSSMESPLGRD